MRSMGAWWCDDRLGFAVRTNRQGAVCESSAGVGLPELGAPPPDRLLTHRDTAYEHQLPDLTEAEREPDVQPHTVDDDLDRVAVALLRRRCGAHPRILPGRPHSPT
jgi:hypothetical protein